MIPERQNIGSCCKKLVGYLSGDAFSSGGIFGVSDDSRNRSALTQLGYYRLEYAPPRCANDVSDAKNLHDVRLAYNSHLAVM